MRTCKKVTRVLAALPLLIFTGCGGSGGDDDSRNEQLGTDPLSIDSYREYREGTDLSGIWMMVVHAQFDYQDRNGQTQHGSTDARATLFIEEDSASSTGMFISNPFCAFPPFSNTRLEFSGSKITLATSGAIFDLDVENNSRITGEIEPPAAVTIDCETNDACVVPISNMSSTADLVKIAPLPEPRGDYYFGADRPAIGNVTTRFIEPGFFGPLTLAFEPVSCLAQFNVKGPQLLAPFPFASAESNYENIIVNHGKGFVLFAEKSGSGIHIENVSFTFPIQQNMFRTEFEQGWFSTKGANPSTIKVDTDSSSDSSSDASSDAAEIEINLDI